METAVHHGRPVQIDDDDDFISMAANRLD